MLRIHIDIHLGIFGTTQFCANIPSICARRNMAYAESLKVGMERWPEKTPAARVMI